MNGFGEFVARLVRNSPFFNVLNRRTVTVYLQKSPGKPGAGARGVSGLRYEVRAGGRLVGQGTTADDGKVEVPLRGGAATVRLTHGGAAVEYEVRYRMGGFSAVNTVEGQKERLRRLGYQIGHGGGLLDGVDANVDGSTERSVLDFQVDSGMVANGTVDANVRNRLTNEAGG